MSRCQRQEGHSKWREQHERATGTEGKLAGHLMTILLRRQYHAQEFGLHFTGTVKQHDQICIVERLLWQLFGGKIAVGETKGKGSSLETRAVVLAHTTVGLN